MTPHGPLHTECRARRLTLVPPCSFASSQRRQSETVGATLVTASQLVSTQTLMSE
jgi:hypothetical protein